MAYFTLALLSFVGGYITHNYITNKVSSAIADLKNTLNRIEGKVTPPEVTVPETPVTTQTEVTTVSNPN